MVSANEKPNFEYFEQTKNQDEKEQEKALTKLNQTLAKSDSLEKVEDIHTQFSNYLFGESSNADEENALSRYVAKEIELLLTQKASLILKSLPVMPNTVVMLIKELESAEFDTNILIDAVKREPSMAADVIKLANSAKFRRGDKDITDLKSAFMVMGSKGLLEGVIYSYLSNFTPTANVYFKQFGDKIWHHSQQCADLTQSLIVANGKFDLAATAYFVGLIRNIGQMIIFQLMVDAFSYVDPASSPSSKAFKQLIQTYSLKLTYTIAKAWQLPDFIIRSLKFQVSAEQSQQLAMHRDKDPLALISFEANMVSELICLQENKMVDEDYVNKELSKLIFSAEIKNILAQTSTHLSK